MARRSPVGFLLLLVVCSLCAGLGSATTATSADRTTTFDTTGSAVLAAGDTAAYQADSSIRLTQELRLTPDRPGEYEAVHRYSIPDDVTGLNVTFGDRSTVVASTGFDRTGTREYAWDGSTEDPTISLRVEANQTTTDTGPLGTSGDYRFVDVGEWALVTRPQAVHGWQWRSGDDVDVNFERDTTVAGEGAAGDVVAFLGAQRTYTESAHGQTFHLVVPEAATLAENRSAIFASLIGASDTLRVGDRDESVFVVAAPTESVEWGVRGVQVGDADAWVLDDATLDDPNNVWLHEYVHTRQDFAVERDARWLNEGGATYYGARLALEQELISFDSFREFLGRGTRARYGEAVLANPDTWENDPDYAVGALVTGELDRQVRVATDSGAAFDRVFARLNGQDDSVTAAEFVGHLDAVAGSEVAAAGSRYTTTTERPQPWNATQHGAAFGTTPARFEYAFERADGSSPFGVSGPYREGSLDSSGPLELVTGETLSATIRVRNTGGASGTYEFTPVVGDTVITTESGQLGPNESAVHAVEYTVEEPGQFAFAADGKSTAVQVRVRTPAVPTVTRFDAEPRRLEPGDIVTLSVDVSNDADRPARGTVPVTLRGAQVDSRSVALDAGADRTLTVERRLEAPGQYTFGLGDASNRTVTVVVEAPFPTTLVLAGGAGLGGFLVVVVGLVWWYRRRRSGPDPGTTDPWEY